MAASVARGVGLGSPLSESDWWCDRATDAGVVACRAVLAHQVRRGVDRHIGDAWPSPRSTRGGEAGEGRSRRRGAGGDLGVRQQGTAGLNPALGQRVETGRLGPFYQTRAGNIALRIALTQTHQGLVALIHLDASAGPQLSPAKSGRRSGGPRKVETSF